MADDLRRDDREDGRHGRIGKLRGGEGAWIPNCKRFTPLFPPADLTDPLTACKNLAELAARCQHQTRQEPDTTGMEIRTARWGRIYERCSGRINAGSITHTC
jgi:hypothetical protein